MQTIDELVDQLRNQRVVLDDYPRNISLPVEPATKHRSLRKAIRRLGWVIIFSQAIQAALVWKLSSRPIRVYLREPEPTTAPGVRDLSTWDPKRETFGG